MDDRAVTSQDDGLRLPNDLASSKRPRRLETPIDLINSIELPLQKSPSLALNSWARTHDNDSALAPWLPHYSSQFYLTRFVALYNHCVGVTTLTDILMR